MTADRRTHGPPITRDDTGCRLNVKSAGHGHPSAQVTRTRAVAGKPQRVPAPARMSRPGGPEPSAAPSYHGMLAVDIKGFNDPRRDHEIRRSLRVAMYELLAGSLHRSGLPWDACYHEDRGDGVLVVAPTGVPAVMLLYPVAEHLRAAVRRHNRFHVEIAQIRLRTAVHAGEVCFDHHGVCGGAVTHLFRMLEASTFKQALDASGADFALVTSNTIFTEVVLPGMSLIDPDMYAPVHIRCKETSARTWIYLPPVRHPALDRVAGRGGGSHLKTVAGAVRRSAILNSALAKLSASQEIRRPASDGDADGHEAGGEQAAG